MSIFSEDSKKRKDYPVFDGAIMYFPRAIREIAKVSRIGNEQHNPGEPLHWARGKSTDQFNTGLRHLIDHRMGIKFAADGQRNLGQANWRFMAALELDLEADELGAVAMPDDPFADPSSLLSMMRRAMDVMDADEYRRMRNLVTDLMDRHNLAVQKPVVFNEGENVGKQPVPTDAHETLAVVGSRSIPHHQV